MRLLHLINMHDVCGAVVKRHRCILSPKAPNEDTEAISARGSQDSRQIIIEILYRMSKKRDLTPLCFCAHTSCQDGPWGSGTRDFLYLSGDFYDYHWYIHMNPQFLDTYILVLSLVLLSVPVIKYSGSLQTQAAHYLPQQSGSQWPVMSCYPWHRPITAPWHCFRHGRSGRSWEDSLAPGYTTAGFVQKTRISYEEPIAVNRLLFPLHKGLIQRGYSFNKAFDSVEDPWLCCGGGTQPYRLRGEYRSVCTAQSSGSKYLIQGYKREKSGTCSLRLPWVWLLSIWLNVFYCIYSSCKKIPH